MLFVAYAATLAVTEPAERSVIGDHAAEHERGTAYGLYHLASGLLVLPGAVLFGVIWQRFGSSAAFAAAAVVTACGAGWMLWLASRGAARPAVGGSVAAARAPWREASSCTTCSSVRLRAFSSTSRW